MSGYLTTREVAAQLRCSPGKIRQTALQLGIGIALGGRAGYRFSEADVAAMTEALRGSGQEVSA